MSKLAGKWMKFRRRPEARAGRHEIFVWTNPQGAPMDVGKDEAQCSTLDRIPFCMKLDRVKKNYEPTGVEMP